MQYQLVIYPVKEAKSYSERADLMLETKYFTFDCSEEAALFGNKYLNKKTKYVMSWKVYPMGE